MLAVATRPPNSGQVYQRTTQLRTAVSMVVAGPAAGEIKPMQLSLRCIATIGQQRSCGDELRVVAGKESRQRHAALATNSSKVRRHSREARSGCSRALVASR